MFVTVAPLETVGSLLTDGAAHTLRLIAKTNVKAGGDTVLPGTVKVEPSNTPVAPAPRVEPAREVVQPTAEEKHNVSELLKLLDF